MKRMLPFAAFVLVRCGGFHQAPCNAGVCSGCCDSSGSCQPGTTDTACGGGGVACSPCASSQACVSQACVVLAQDAGEPDGGGGQDSGAPFDAGSSTDSGSVTDSGTPDSGPPFQALAPCIDAGMYVLGTTTIQFGAGMNTYRPNCVSVTAGSKINWSGSFTVHPLRPSTRGTQPNPIHFVDAGTDAGFTFPNPGFYPFYCLVHGTDGGTGMAGVIQVTP